MPSKCQDRAKPALRKSRCSSGRPWLIRYLNDLFDAGSSRSNLIEAHIGTEKDCHARPRTIESRASGMCTTSVEMTGPEEFDQRQRLATLILG